MSGSREPWALYVEGASKCMGRSPARSRLVNLADREFPGRKVQVAHAITGETWERRRGGWYKTVPAKPVEERSA